MHPLINDLIRDRTITAITLDSRKVRPGLLFCAYPGEKSDGRKFIQQAIQQGAAAIVYEPRDFNIKEAISLLPLARRRACPRESGDGRRPDEGIPCIPIEDLQKNVSKITSLFYQQELKNLEIIGVTGTNGKTSLTHYLAQAWSYLQKTCGVLGTVGYGVYQGNHADLTTLNLTTPDPVTLIECIVQMQKQGAQKVAMEVSAHALTQGRVTGLNFDTAIFTNLSQDHLDYYGDMAAYGEAKSQLFSWPNLSYAIVNCDDPFSKTVIQKIKALTEIVGYSLENETLPKKFVRAKKVEHLDHGYRCEITSSWGDAVIETSLIGRFNISNLLACLATLLAKNVEFNQAIKAVEQLIPVPGRMQVFGGGINPRVIVDYAHTPDALEKALIASREHLKGKLFCIFGCGGDRDPLKRPIMAKIAEQQADYIIITQDNSRTEPWPTILKDIQKGLADKEKAIVIDSREEAIRHAIFKANKDDVILVAGKGHENYQILGNQTFDFDDRIWVQRILQENKE